MTHHRTDRVADVLRGEIARLLREEVRDPAIGFITITDVRLSPDLRSARVFVSALDRDEEATLHALGRAAPFIRRMLARCAALRFTPELHFVFDRSVAAGSRVEGLLRSLRDEGAPPAPAGAEDGGGEDGEPED